MSAYELDKNAPWVTFNFLPEQYGVNPSEIKNVYVKGSFTQWALSPSWALCASNGTWSLTVHNDLVKIPGNSGFAEFKFFVTLHNGVSFEPDMSLTEETLMENALLFTEEPTPAQKKELERAKKITAEPSAPRDKNRLANVRQVPGTVNLFRGYHPYKKSRPNLSTEDERIKRVNEYLEEQNVKSIITLCGNEELDASLGESVTPYVKSIQDNGNQCFIDTSYETVYFKSNSKEYGDTVRQIVRFINSHPSPFYIHCRLGSDRTGTMSAVLAALTGASWKEIAKDYEQTSKAGFMEYRNKILLAYSFEHILGKHPQKVKDLSSELSECFIQKGILTQKEIETLQKKLSS